MNNDDYYDGGGGDDDDNDTYPIVSRNVIQRTASSNQIKSNQIDLLE